jgi:hypothetical protein
LESARSQNFSGNLDFRPEKFGSTNFRPDFFWIFQISNRKKPGRKNLTPTFFTIFNFRGKKDPANPTFKPKSFGWKKFRTVLTERDRLDQFLEVCDIFVMRPVTKGDFSNFRGDHPGIFLRESLYAAKFCGAKCFARETFGGKAVLEKAAVPAPGIVQVSFAF